jgi:hypothetical protein
MDLKEIEWLISKIPLRSYNIVDGDLDTPFLMGKRYKSNSISNDVEFIRSRRIINLLTRILNNHPEQLDEFEISESNLEHFIGTLKQNYETDVDVERLLAIPNIRNMTHS